MSDQTKSLHDALDAFMSKHNYHHPVTEARLVNYWPELMGKTIDKYTEQILLKGSTLIVEVGPAALKQELFYSKEKIKDRINEHFKKEIVEKVVIR